MHVQLWSQITTKENGLSLFFDLKFDNLECGNVENYCLEEICSRNNERKLTGFIIF